MEIMAVHPARFDQRGAEVPPRTSDRFFLLLAFHGLSDRVEADAELRFDCDGYDGQLAVVRACWPLGFTANEFDDFVDSINRGVEPDARERDCFFCFWNFRSVANRSIDRWFCYVLFCYVLGLAHYRKALSMSLMYPAIHQAHAWLPRTHPAC